jgi:hypothetical protein
MMDKWPGEDIGFSRLCVKHDIKMWVDCTTTSPHITPAVVDESSWRQWLAANPGQLKEGVMDLNEVKHD